jgi:hypothetical protein
MACQTDQQATLVGPVCHETNIDGRQGDQVRMRVMALHASDFDKLVNSNVVA